MKKRLLLISADKDLPQCSFHELGLSLHEFLQTCKSVDVDFFNSGSRSPIIHPNSINESYDLVLFNYMWVSMGYFPKEYFDLISIPKLMINYETRATPWSSPCHLGIPLKQLFDYMIIPDTSLDTYGDETVITIPRIINARNYPKRDVNTENPIISTYGLPSTEKDILGIYNAICDEFDSATFRIHFCPDSRSGARYMYDLYLQCKERQKDGIILKWSDVFMPHDAVPDWLNQSDLNAFFYTKERDIRTEGTFPGSIDACITAQRPIAVTDNLCTRYITQYIDPWPKKSLKDIMVTCPIDKIYEDSQLSAKKLDEWIGKTF